VHAGREHRVRLDPGAGAGAGGGEGGALSTVRAMLRPARALSAPLLPAAAGGAASSLAWRAQQEVHEGSGEPYVPQIRFTLELVPPLDRADAFAEALATQPILCLPPGEARQQRRGEAGTVGGADGGLGVEEALHQRARWTQAMGQALREWEVISSKSKCVCQRRGRPRSSSAAEAAGAAGQRRGGHGALPGGDVGRVRIGPRAPAPRLLLRLAGPLSTAVAQRGGSGGPGGQETVAQWGGA
jgi:hypothetical protein